MYFRCRVWNEGGNYLYDAIEHEIVHVGDIVSGRAYQYYTDYTDYGDDIMEYRAYSQNMKTAQRRGGFNNEDKYLGEYIKRVNYHRDRIPKEVMKNIK